jgi:DNA-binding NarL/FixJ family response regulator
MPTRTVIDRERVRQLLERGLTQAQIARRLGFSDSTVHTAVKKIKEDR